ncbi:MAG: DNA repair protein RecO [Clostridia bacterium]|nr:DNA repair protein RecO [Clostridia bacterium]
MKLLKVKGVVIKETQYKDNDKILTLLTDEFGKISCIAKGAKKTNSSLLAPCQFLVCSEFVLYKGTTFYHINSAEIIDTFYNLRIDYEKLEVAYEITKILSQTVGEGEDAKEILSLFLNTLYVIENKDIEKDLVISIFKLKLISLLGYMPDVVSCKECGQTMLDREKKNYYYSFIDNSSICENCYDKQMKEDNFTKQKSFVKLSQAVYFALLYVISSIPKKVFNFSLEKSSLEEFKKFCDMLYTVLMQ